MMYDYEKQMARQKRNDATFDFIISVGIIALIFFMLIAWTR